MWKYAGVWFFIGNVPGCVLSGFQTRNTLTTVVEVSRNLVGYPKFANTELSPEAASIVFAKEHPGVLRWPTQALYF